MIPGLVIGNVIMGERFTEPIGKSFVKNVKTKEICELEFKSKVNSSKPADLNYMSGHIKDSNGRLRYSISGKYTESFIARDLDTGNSFTIFEAPKFPRGPQETKKIYGMNLFSLQLNNISDKLRAKLPPTDSRLRQDIRLWESADMAKAQEAFTKITQIQRNRRTKLQMQFKAEGRKVDMYDEKKWYTP
jgi:hypothetical protein